MEFVSKWHPNRMGMIDFWYYTDEVFHFDHGHMLLRGSNGSGKSVTMQSFLPLLLDGNKSSERLDPFGTRSRRIENYLLEEDGGRDDRIAYLYLEFKREESETYKTIGMGLHARRGKPLDAWYFIIEDNRRIGYDISLMQNHLAISRQMLKNIIQDQLILSQKEYCEKVNQALFGFERLEDYKEAIDLLLQLRSPKLSNSLKPTMLNEILNNSLRPLSEEDLRPMSEAISNMDNIKDQLDALKQSRQAAQSVWQVYEQYGRALLYEKGQLYRQACTKEQANSAQEAAIQERLVQETAEKEECRRKEQEITEKLALLKKEEEDLNASDRLRMIKEVQELEEDVKRLKKEETQKEQTLEKKDDLLQDACVHHERIYQQQEVQLMEIQEHVHGLDGLQEELHMEEHEVFRKEYRDSIEQEYDFSYIRHTLMQREQRISKAVLKLQEYDAQKQLLQQLQDAYEKREDETLRQQKQAVKAENYYDEVLEEYREGVNTWFAGLKHLHMAASALESMQLYLQEYEEKRTFLPMLSLVQEALQKDKERLYTKRIRKEQEMQDIAEKELACVKELKEWEQQQDPSPFCTEGQQQNRAYLDAKQIAYRPFYTLLEFEEGVSEELKGQLEEYLARNNLLDALVVHKDVKELVCAKQKGAYDNYLFVEEAVEKLSQGYLHGDTLTELHASFLAYCRQLHLSFEGNRLDENGYETGAMYGTLAMDQAGSFIGRETRRRYREQKIAELKQLLEAYRQQEEALKQETDMLLVQEKQLKEEANAFIKEDDLQQALSMWKEEEERLALYQQALKQDQHNIKETQKQLRVVLEAVHEEASYFRLPLQQEIFLSYQHSLQEYREELHKLQSAHMRVLSLAEMKRQYAMQQEQLQEDVDNLKYEVEQLKDACRRKEQLFAQKKQQLKEAGGEDLTRRLQEIAELLRVLPQKQLHYAKRSGSLDTSIRQLQEDLEKRREEGISLRKKTEVYRDIMKEQAAHGCVRIAAEEEKQLLQMILLEEKTHPVNKRSEVLKGDVQAAFYAQRGGLQEYQPTLFMDEQWSDAIDVTSRIHLKVKLQGKLIAFEALLPELDKSIETQQYLLEDSDRHLFEDILINIISKKIRIRIQDSKRWVDMMNHYMNTMTDTSSGLRLSLQWKHKKAENENELDTKELVELLQKDAGIMRDSDLKRLSLHFRTRIEEVRRVLAEEENEQSFHQLMRIVMDYRQWFEFKILAQKGNENKKELTNHLFFSFSGGEKAMAMYVPLFSAVAAKFESSRKDAPLLIALDEAFAGVDDKNIGIMFSLIEKFGFDYIMNSQVLWGDYPSVGHLAIYELFRPDNAKYVTLIPYEWDGKVKRMKLS